MRVQHLCMLVHDWAILGTRRGKLNKVQNRVVDKKTIVVPKLVSFAIVVPSSLKSLPVSLLVRLLIMGRTNSEHSLK